MATLPELSKSEWIIMNAIWDFSGRDGITLAEFYRALDHESWAIGTVRSFLVRLVNKGYVKTSTCPYGNLYKPAVARGGVVKRAVREFAKVVLKGDNAPVVQYLVSDCKISKKNAKVLEKWTQK